MNENHEKLISVENALQIMLSHVSVMDPEMIKTLESYGRVLVEDIISNINIPPLNNSAMDGYAVKFEDTVNSSVKNPKKLDVIGEVKAGGQLPKIIVKDNTAVRIMTGASVPDGATAVIPVEDTSEENDVVSIYKEMKNNANIRFAGEDIRKGQLVLSKGCLIRSADVGLLASMNYSEIKVYKKPDVAILSTGDEVVEVGEDIMPGQIRNSNAYTLYSEVKKYNAVPHYIGIARDSLDDTYDKFKKALNYDIVITTGGVSMGKYDFVKDVMEELSVEITINKIRMKPGKPLVFGTKDKTLVFGLPGNPVSTMISFIQFVRPVLLKMMGATNLEKPVIKAILKNEIRKKPDRKNFIRGYFSIEDGEIYVSTTGPQGSGILRSMSEANCLIIIPDGVEVAKKNEKVSIQLIGHEEML